MPRANSQLTADAPAPGEPTRRRLFALAGAVIAGPAITLAASPAHPDAALLAALAEFDRLEREMWPPGPGPATIAAEEERDARIAPLNDRQAELLGVICAMRATTLHGCIARACSLFVWDLEMQKAIAAGDDPKEYDDACMIQALVRDLVQVTA
jgi:hypothetical protein